MIILGIGSNLGDRLANLRHALRLLRQVKEITVKQVSPVYISDPLLPDKPTPGWQALPYLNAAIGCATHLAPLEFLAILKNIEKEIGRPDQYQRWSPRLIDIDILVWDDLVIEHDRLKVPHIGLCERPFALWPVADLAPNYRYKSGGSAKPTKPSGTNSSINSSINSNANNNTNNEGKTAAEICVAWGSRFTGEAPLHTRQIAHRIDTPQIVGILNVTPDSFSDGGLYAATDAALAQAERMFAAGADVIDIGAESTRPSNDNSAMPLSPEAEWQRLEPILAALTTAHWKTRNTLSQQAKIQVTMTTNASAQAAQGQAQEVGGPKISIDTRHPVTARRAIEQFHVDWINDVTGGDDSTLHRIIAEAGTTLVFMHHLGVPPNSNVVLSSHEDVVQQVCAWRARRVTQLLAAGIKTEQLIFDPGIGFGKTAAQSWELIKRCAEFTEFDANINGEINAINNGVAGDIDSYIKKNFYLASQLPILIGHSRKSFLNQFTAKPFTERDIETAAISTYIMNKNVAYIRVHNVEINARAMKIVAATAVE